MAGTEIEPEGSGFVLVQPPLGEGLLQQPFAREELAPGRDHRHIELPALQGHAGLLAGEDAHALLARAVEDGLAVARGGSFASRPKDATSSFKLYYLPWQKVYDVGFRVLCSAGLR